MDRYTRSSDRGRLGLGSSLGGGVGAVARYSLGLWVVARLGAAFPFHTLLIKCDRQPGDWGAGGRANRALSGGPRLAATARGRLSWGLHHLLKLKLYVRGARLSGAGRLASGRLVRAGQQWLGPPCDVRRRRGGPHNVAVSAQPTLEEVLRMDLTGTGTRVRIYFGERDHYHDQACAGHFLATGDAECASRLASACPRSGSSCGTCMSSAPRNGRQPQTCPQSRTIPSTRSVRPSATQPRCSTSTSNVASVAGPARIGVPMGTARQRRSWHGAAGRSRRCGAAGQSRR
jgi:hypothetical protein